MESRYRITVLLSVFQAFCVSFAATAAYDVQQADFNRDGAVTGDDLYLLAEYWLTSDNPKCIADVDGDCLAAMPDFACLSAHWLGASCSSFAAVASSQTEGTAAANILDGLLSTCWRCTGLNDEWVQIDLGQIRSVTGLDVYWTKAYARRYAVEVSAEGRQWMTLYEESNGDGNDDSVDFATTAARYVRVRCMEAAQAAGYAIYEVFVRTEDDCPSAGRWELLWSDEFEGDELDASKWQCMTGTGNDAPFDYAMHGWGNSELQYYTDRPENVRVDGGNLTISARRESYADRQFTSARIRTAGLADFLYGRIEARIQVPSGDGLWPAFWMMPTGDMYGRPYFDWAAHGEMDIMETRNDATYIGGAIHFGGRWPYNVSTAGTYAPPGAEFARDFHVYTLEWTPTWMKWYVDGILYSTKTSWSSANGPYPAPFDQPFHILLNLAVGGHYTGCTSLDCITDDLPQSLVVDYVRVYRRVNNPGRLEEHARQS